MSRRLHREALGAAGGEGSGDALLDLMAAEQDPTREPLAPAPALRATAAHAPRLDGPPARRPRADETNIDLCDVGQTQDLPDDFFSLYHTQPQPQLQPPQSPLSATSTSPTEAHGNFLEDAVLPTDAAEDGSAGGVRVDRRTDCRHAQQSQYVPTSTDDFEDNEVDDADGADSAATTPVADPATTSPVPLQPPSSDAPTAAAKAELDSDAPPQQDTQREYPHAWWPHPHPPPPTALPLPRQTRRAFHSQRYGAFIKAYLGLSDIEVEQAQRRGRGICMIGVCKAPAPTSASAAPLLSAADTRARRLGEPVRVRRTFLRHSVLAVEGDAVFSELIDRAEVLYAVNQQRLDAAAAAAVAAAGRGAGATEAASPASCANGGNSSSGSGGNGHAGPPHAPRPPPFPQFRRLPRMVEPHLRPNARCIALHYGLPHKTEPPLAAAKTESADRDGGNPYPRASLMAVVCTTRLGEGEEIYVSLESYHRCLDEVAWYRRCYGALNRRYADAAGSPAAADLVGDLYDGVQRFPDWPTELAYYHGVGRRHASDTAEAAFPFTLVGLGAAPELGEHQKGVVATAWLPYGTCLLYCGPSVATRKVERLVSERALRGGGAAIAGVGAASDETRNAPPCAGEVSDDEDLSFVTDDTYALGLGRHGVCFGQGLTRYVNHRYNTSRFGNVELCSVMLSVPSEFAAAGVLEATAAAGRASGESPYKGGGAAAAASATASPSSPAACTFNPAMASLSAEERARVARAAAAVAAAKQSLGVRRGRPLSVKKGAVTVAGGGTRARDGAPYAPSEGGGAAAVVVAALSVKGKGRHQRRRVRHIFHEEGSFFVTVPFFLVTSDTAPGTPLLAWTYGEEYDAKLERHAVADGHLVPYADAALLNCRLAQPSCRYQRYSGDYRFAVGLGDVVWRRRPVRLAFPAGRCCGCGPLRGGSIVGDGDGVSDVYVPPPEADLFVVVQTGRAGLDRVLLRPLQRVPLTNRQLMSLLREQCLETYVSPHMPAAAAASLPWGGVEGRRRGGRPPSEQTKRQRAEAAMLSFDWTAHWAVLRLTDTGALAPVPSTSGASAGSSTSPAAGVATAAYITPQALARYEEALRTCVVATLDSLALLLMDVDYSAVHRRRGAGTAAAAPGSVTDLLESLAASTPTAATAKLGGACSATTSVSTTAAADAHRHIIVNLDDLRHATALVRTSPERAAAVPALCHGLLWPLYSSGVPGLGGEAVVDAGAGRRAATRAST